MPAHILSYTYDIQSFPGLGDAVVFGIHLLPVNRVPVPLAQSLEDVIEIDPSLKRQQRDHIFQDEAGGLTLVYHVDTVSIGIQSGIIHRLEFVGRGKRLT